MPSRHPLTREAFIEDLKRQAPLAWPAVWGSAYAHLEACLQAAYVELERLLAIPEVYRTRLKREMREVLRLIAEKRPEEVGPIAQSWSGADSRRPGDRGVGRTSGD